MDEQTEIKNVRKARLAKSKTDRIIWGVCGGLAEYFGVDAVIVRLIFVVLALVNGAGILLYIILALIMPKPEDVHLPQKDVIEENVQEMAEQLKEAVEQVGEQAKEVVEKADQISPPDLKKQEERARWLGAILILLGIILLLNNFNLLWWLRWDVFWSLVIILIGLWLLIRRMEK